VRVATFVADATPPVGSPLCVGQVPPAIGVTDRLSCRGIVLHDDGPPVVLAALDWVGVLGSGHRRWRESLAEAAGTTPERVAVHTLHQHDAPGFDPDAEALMAARGQAGRGYHRRFAERAIADAQDAIRAALPYAEPVTHVGAGAAPVHRVASNRRVLGPDGTVAHVRYSADRTRVGQTAAEGIVDPLARAVSFWNGDRPVAVLSYYATHPQSHYRERLVTSDFVGLARDRVQSAVPAVWTHFCGAAGNITAGKYNDGSPGNRPVLSARLADGLAQAFAASRADRAPAGPFGWTATRVTLPIANHLRDGRPQRAFDEDPEFDNASDAAFAARNRDGAEFDLGCLSIGDTRILHLPGELFVEYQLAAQHLRPDLFVAVAAYGDCGPWYIGTRLAYSQGGYETGRWSRVAAAAEDVLFPAIAELLGGSRDDVRTPSDITSTAPRLPG
jgi:hypothetical protein